MSVYPWPGIWVGLGLADWCRAEGWHRVAPFDRVYSSAYPLSYVQHPMTQAVEDDEDCTSAQWLAAGVSGVRVIVERGRNC